ncbi:uncharacterized protein LOC131804754 isoform X2 [Musca domestica]|uniref:Uncharacterized protein LOC131800655 isoform X2 n=1 Tax=Musca domestica TaxID=7370 RepID=A0ABM3VDN0_MUSDO|nr:uncharacterized protein LOC131800655 isoform X2 [Musca domestica]XP_058974233.1 uncharacterized protein LOC131800655 isoform X2 [Musca domestica]XP_058983892.1 uncharacterized protein LOC131804754 isoform X2 [Musca domestica]XP_058983894.1 uncharacterized protein LOC131804754 isoform X2 [Musca domestica]
MPSLLTCNVCKDHIAKSKYKIGCKGCANFFHLDCVGISEAEAKINKQLRYTCVCCVRAAGGSGDAGVVDRGTKANTAVDASRVGATADASLNGGDGTVGVAACDFVGNSDALRELQDNLILSMKQQMDTYMARCLSEFRTKTDALFDLYNAQISEVKRDVVELKKAVVELKMTVSEVKSTALLAEKKLADRISELESFNNVLQRRLNRADIIIRGLPENIKDLRSFVVKVANLCGLQLSHGDMQQCCYISERRAVLVKFNSIQTRDSLIRRFVKRGKVTLKEVMENCLLESRIYLNDHLVKSASSLVFACRGLLKKKKIKKFRLLNSDEPQVEVILADGSKTIFERQELLEFARSCPLQPGGAPLVGDMLLGV